MDVPSTGLLGAASVPARSTARRVVARVVAWTLRHGVHVAGWGLLAETLARRLEVTPWRFDDGAAIAYLGVCAITVFATLARRRAGAERAALATPSAAYRGLALTGLAVLVPLELFIRWRIGQATLPRVDYDFVLFGRCAVVYEFALRSAVLVCISTFAEMLARSGFWSYLRISFVTGVGALAWIAIPFETDRGSALDLVLAAAATLLVALGELTRPAGESKSSRLGGLTSVLAVGAIFVGTLITFGARAHVVEEQHSCMSTPDYVPLFNADLGGLAARARTADTLMISGVVALIVGGMATRRASADTWRSRREHVRSGVGVALWVALGMRVFVPEQWPLRAMSFDRRPGVDWSVVTPLLAYDGSGELSSLEPVYGSRGFAAEHSLVLDLTREPAATRGSVTLAGAIETYELTSRRRLERIGSRFQVFGDDAEVAKEFDVQVVALPRSRIVPILESVRPTQHLDRIRPWLWTRARYRIRQPGLDPDPVVRAIAFAGTVLRRDSVREWLAATPGGERAVYADALRRYDERGSRVHEVGWNALLIEPNASTGTLIRALAVMIPRARGWRHPVLLFPSDLPAVRAWCLAGSTFPH